MNELLHNIVWHALIGAHARLAAGSGGARRYQRGVTDLVGFADAAAPDFAALRACCETGERFYCLGWTGPAPSGWTVEREARIVKMVWDVAGAPGAVDAVHPVPMGVQHRSQMMALAELTQPGPFGPRTHELGDYVGVFEGDALVAMAGERMHADRLREISAVCTHPQQQGRGLARSLMLHLIRVQLARGQTPFLHVMRHNETALGLYERMGFRVFAETAVRIVRAE